MSTDASGSGKEAAYGVVASKSSEFVALSHAIHGHPELSFEEFESSQRCADALESAGFDVTSGICELPTAFSATIGSGPLEIAICCEYDALPDVGHACGHNIIAAAAVGAGVALAGVADDLGLRIRVLGTPAEEGGGGKILMLERGGFDGLHAAMMVHPWPSELVQMPCLAVTHIDVEFTGREAHASAFPELGINALDAITVAQVAIGLLRQHANAGDQVHGIITLGGAAPNIVPAKTRAKYYIRSTTLEGLETWQPRVERCFEAGAVATGASHRVIPQGPAYSEFRYDEEIAAYYRENAQALGRTFATPTGKIVAASTDMGNVSLAMPSIHPTLGLDSLPAVNHQAEFAAHCATPIADLALLDGAKAMAATIIDLATNDETRARLLATSYRH